jgi:hypothetical protein
MYHNSRNNARENKCYSLQSPSQRQVRRETIQLPGEVKNVLARSSVAVSRISRVICTNRPIKGGTRWKPRILLEENIVKSPEKYFDILPIQMKRGDFSMMPFNITEVEMIWQCLVVSRYSRKMSIAIRGRVRSVVTDRA